MKASISFINAEEFQKLLERAATLSEQLQETLQQINDFELDIEVNKTATATMEVEMNKYSNPKTFFENSKLSKSERAFLVAANQVRQY
ncbi:hypothetical protein V7149_01595 [Bacillus sp. JJ1503]|uniref:hypothetical protein n=1 Tax=Bacillus sp. JJ1503 TaxID=3122956 RepID=UPI0030006733